MADDRMQPNLKEQPQPGEGPLHSVDDARAFPDQALALPIGPLGVLLRHRRDACHGAMAPFPTQPPQEPALEQLSVQPVGLCPAMFPRNRYTRGMDHVRLYPRASSQRASQKPSRPASKASAIRVIVRPALTASSRQRCSTAGSRSGLGSSFLRG